MGDAEREPWVGLIPDEGFRSRDRGWGVDRVDEELAVGVRTGSVSACDSERAAGLSGFRVNFFFLCCECGDGDTEGQSRKRDFVMF